jgi:hypothetical protein
MDPFTIIFGLLGFAEQLLSRAAQSGELTDAQKAVLQAKADGLFAKYSVAPSPPPGVAPAAPLG